MCQIDLLQRLKYERNNIEKALKTLPKTLDETYDMILQEMPHQELMVVYHIFQWISYHSELYEGQGIPCDTLVQAIGKSTAELTIDGLERFYDNDVLRELCGCLIKILPEERINYSRDVKVTIPAVSFAHYTVREYLDSHCPKNTEVFSYNPHEELRQHVLGIVFSEAHHIELNEQWKDENDSIDPSDVFDAIHGNLVIYCAASAILSLFKWPAEISQHETLCSLAIGLLDPSKHHFEILSRTASIIEESVFDDDIFRPENRFWRMSWHAETSNMGAVHLYHLLLLAETDKKCVLLAEKFLQGKDMRDLFQARLRFDREVFVEMDVDTYIFDGSIIEVFAQLAEWSEDPFRLLLNHGAGLFDCSKVLLLYMNSHEPLNEPNCQEDCLLRRLLELGADPNSRGSRITPLQIAVVSKDVAGVRTLLDAGADPNATGSSTGLVWGNGTIMSRFNDLDGESALYISRKTEPIESRHRDGIRWDVREEYLKTIESILLQYRAQGFKRV